MENIQQKVRSSILELYGIEVNVTVTRPDPEFGDGATNVALQLASKLGKPPKDVATEIANKLQESGEFSEVSVAGPGFLNIRFSDSVIKSMVDTATVLPQVLKGKVVVAEYSDPNPFKILHAGHLYTSIIGDAVANVLEAVGATVHRVNFGGDVGLHAAKMLWSITKKRGVDSEKLTAISNDDLNELVTECYVDGNAAYDNNETAKSEIVALNKQIYGFHATNDTESPTAKMYWKIRSLYYDVYFKEFYSSIGTHFEKFYPESQTAPIGLAIVKEQLARGVYKESNGAVVFEGEKYGLHTRVFINSEGLPTYEAKDVGLIVKKYDDYTFDMSLVITGNDIVEYMKVVLKSVEQFAPHLVSATTHLTHGIVKLEGGVKMSSRLGNILRAEDILLSAAEANKAANGNDSKAVVLGAVKYAFLKQRIGGDIIYDPNESISIVGNSGPYLQYAYARAKSIMDKSHKPEDTGAYNFEYSAFERQLAVKVSEYPEVIEKVLQEYMPHHICTYLYELTQSFNRFYENEKVIGSDRETDRLTLLSSYIAVLKNGLNLLGIEAPNKM